MTVLEEEKQGIINLLIWYRDEYHKNDFCHSKLIEEVKQIKEMKQLERFWQILDAWID